MFFIKFVDDNYLQGLEQPVNVQKNVLPIKKFYFSLEMATSIFKIHTLR